MSVSREKVVRFDDNKTKIVIMRVWSFAAHQARIGKWEQVARDRSRFKKRIQEIGQIIDCILVKKYEKYVKNKH